MFLFAIVCYYYYYYYYFSHGTKCAGFIAGQNDTNCGVGIAFGAQISSRSL